MSLKKNLLKNGIASLLQKGIRVLDQLLLVPFFITAWGAAYYGEWLTLTIIPTILGLSDFGFGTAAASTFVLRYASGDKQGAMNIAKSAFFIVSGVIIFGLLLSLLGLIILDHYQVFNKTLINREDAILSISILMFARLLGFLQQIFEAYFRAARRAARSINLLSINSGFILLLSILVLLLNGGVVYFALVNLLVTMCFLVIYCITALQVLPDRKDFKGVVFLKDIKYITGKGFGYLMTPIWQATFFQGTTFVVRLVLGPEAVAIFNTVRTVTRSVNQIFNLVTGAIISELQFEIGARNMEKVRKIFRVSLVFVVVIALIGMVCLYLFGPWLYELWTRKVLTPPSMMWNVFILGIGFNAIWWLTAVVFPAMNKPYDFAIAGLISASFSVLCSYFLAMGFGLTGAAIGSLVMDLLLFIYVFPRSCKLIGQKMRTLVKDSITDYQEIWVGQIKPLLIKNYK